MKAFDIIQVLHINIFVGINVLLLLLSIFFSLLSSYEILSFNIEWILATEFNFEKFNQLKFVSLPVDRIFMLKFDENIFILGLKKVIFHIMRYCM